MTTDEVKEHFVTWANAMRKCDLSVHAYCNWLAKGYIPYHSQVKIAEVSKGVLKVDIDNKYVRGS